MLLDYLLTPIIIFSLMTVWIVVQFAWKKLFSETLTDEDVLAMRKGCGGCHLGEECNKNDDKCETKA